MSDQRKPSSPQGDYEVGWGKPPKQHQFKKGQSGNPKGRPKRPTHLGGIIEAELDKTVEVVERGRRIRLSYRQLIGKSLVRRAATSQRDAKALLQILQEVQPQQFRSEPVHFENVKEAALAAMRKAEEAIKAKKREDADREASRQGGQSQQKGEPDKSGG